jgi:hypothetical protein
MKFVTEGTDRRHRGISAYLGITLIVCFHSEQLKSNNPIAVSDQRQILRESHVKYD